MSDHTDAIKRLIQRAVALHESGDTSTAEALYREVLRIAPNNFDALHLLGVCAFQQGELQRSADLIAQALELNSQHASACINLGNTLLALGQVQDALAHFERAIKLAPNDPSAHLNRGNALHDAGLLLDALASYDSALALDPSNAEAYNNRGTTLCELTRYPEAVRSFSEALRLKPTFIDALINRSSTLRVLGDLSTALADIEVALRSAPTHLVGLNIRGNILRELGHSADAIKTFHYALTLSPNLADTHLNLSYAYLITGDLTRGFSHYEWRRRHPEFSRVMPQSSYAEWTGTESLQDKKLLIQSEQGFGDTIQFCRYASLAHSRGAHVILEVQPPLKALMKTLSGPAEVIASDEPCPPCDYHAPLLSLPSLFETSLATIPSGGRYLQPPADLLCTWRSRLASAAPVRIGLTWSGSTYHDNDRFRSIPLQELLKALPLGPFYVGLQAEIRDSDRAALASRPDIMNLEGKISDFLDTAAIIESLDLVVTVDSAVAHLAGALDRPVCILLPANGDWRWLCDRSDSPWYPSATILRQARIGDWETVLKRVFDTISQLKPRHTPPT